MAKETGLGIETLNVDDSGGTPADLRNDVTNFDFATPRAVQDVTGVDKFAMERLLLLADFSGTLNGVFNDAAGQSHQTLRTVPSTQSARTITIGVSGQSLAGEVLVTDYGLSRSASGELTWTAPFALADGTIPTWA